MPSASYTYIENITFHKLCFPLTAGLNIKLSGKLNTIVSAGIRTNLLVSGKYFVDRNVRMGSQTYMLEHTYNPLINEWCLNPSERFAFQYTFGISARLKNNYISINYIPGYPITFQRTDYPDYNRELRNNEFNISLIHSFPPLKLKSGAQKEEQEETVFLKNSTTIYRNTISSSKIHIENHAKGYFHSGNCHHCSGIFHWMHIQFCQ